MEYIDLIALVCHVLGRKIILYHLIFPKSCRAISLVTMDLFLLCYICKYMDMLWLFEGMSDEVGQRLHGAFHLALDINTPSVSQIVKIAHILVSASIILLMRYSPRVAESYDRDLDIVPRLVLLLPPLLLSIFLNKVGLISEIFHSFARYLEAVIMIPQLILLYKRGKYESWAAVASFCMGAEGFVRCLPILMKWPGIPQVKSPYLHATAVVQAVIFIVGFMAVAASRVQAMQEQGLNESAAKPAFEEVWEANKVSRKSSVSAHNQFIISKTCCAMQFDFSQDEKEKSGSGSKISV